MAIEKDDRRAWDAMLRQLGQMKRSVVTVGVHENAKPQTDEDGKEVMAMPKLAAIHEFGAHKNGVNIPERSFLRSTFTNKNESWNRAFVRQVARVAEGKQSPEGALIFVGVRMSADVKNTILAGIAPELAAVTVKRRMKKGAHGGGTVANAGATTPLIDSGQLLASIAFEVGDA